MQENEKTSSSRFTTTGLIVAFASYFLIKYGIAAQFFDLQELNFFYSLMLIAACMFLGKAVEKAIEARKKSE